MIFKEILLSLLCCDIFEMYDPTVAVKQTYWIKNRTVVKVQRRPKWQVPNKASQIVTWGVKVHAEGVCHVDCL